MALILIEGPSSEPVSLPEMKNHLRVDFDDEDALITSYIKAARQKLEQRCARSFMEQTWELRVASFEDITEIPKPPTMNVLAVTYLDEVHALQTVDDALYAIVEGGQYEASKLIWLDLDDKPTALATRPDAARIKFTSGWEEVPYDVKQAVLFMASHLYENRASVMLNPVRQELQETPSSVDAFIAPYIVPRL